MGIDNVKHQTQSYVDGILLKNGVSEAKLALMTETQKAALAKSLSGDQEFEIGDSLVKEKPAKQEQVAENKSWGEYAMKGLEYAGKGLLFIIGALFPVSCTREEIINQTTNITVKADIEAALEKFEAKQDAKDAKFFEILEKIYKNVENGNRFNQENQTLLKNILNVLNNLKEEQDDIKESLTKLLEFVSDNNTMTRNTMNLINTIISKLNNLQNKDCDHTSIIVALDKITDAINKIVKSNENMSDDASKLLNIIIGLITAGNEISESNQNLLNMILDKMDSINDGNIDLSSIEAMVKALLEQSKKNGDTLTSIDGKMDVVNVTTKAILAKLEDDGIKNDTRYNNIIKILTAIKDKANSIDEGKLLDKLDKILDNLDKILAAIKDHDVNVTVEQTGKVECTCKCENKNHEGIDQLNELLK